MKVECLTLLLQLYKWLKCWPRTVQAKSYHQRTGKYSELEVHSSRQSGNKKPTKNFRNRSIQLRNATLLQFPILLDQLLFDTRSFLAFNYRWRWRKLRTPSSGQKSHCYYAFSCQEFHIAKSFPEMSALVDTDNYLNAIFFAICAFYFIKRETLCNCTLKKSSDK